ncbi:hypothetical protein HPB52_000977 [Rhipicephalus sanguineus]|uniref:Uncharacterized protein n=1 Tax=Rhipicephalus sanguineus TaxID=34632 RepID=A0A9D4QHL2_RHISA|nr:hypothetical protein HPB52_000977 [Rhipicephalus sanguineus]
MQQHVRKLRPEPKARTAELLVFHIAVRITGAPLKQLGTSAFAQWAWKYSSDAAASIAILLYRAVALIVLEEHELDAHSQVAKFGITALARVNASRRVPDEGQPLDQVSRSEMHARHGRSMTTRATEARAEHERTRRPRHGQKWTIYCALGPCHHDIKKVSLRGYPMAMTDCSSALDAVNPLEHATVEPP